MKRLLIGAFLCMAPLLAGEQMLEVQGFVAPSCQEEVKSRVEGVLLKKHVHAGQKVSQGDLLFTIDPRLYEVKLEKAEASLEKDKAALVFARKRIDRYERLAKKDFVAEINLDEYQKELVRAEADVKMATAELALAKMNYEHCFIRAPVEGEVGRCESDPGSWVPSNGSKALTTIRSMSPAVVECVVPLDFFQDLKCEQCEDRLRFTANLVGRSIPRREGRVIFVEKAVDAKEGTIRVLGLVQNDDNLFWLGEKVQVQLYKKKPVS